MGTKTCETSAQIRDTRSNVNQVPIPDELRLVKELLPVRSIYCGRRNVLHQMLPQSLKHLEFRRPYASTFRKNGKMQLVLSFGL